MKNRTMVVLFGGALLSSLSACVVAASEPVHEVDGVYGDEVYVGEPAPPPRSNVIVGVAPGPNYVWVDGYWTRHRDNWHWVNGRWAARPRPNAVWVNGHWDHHPRGYVWRRGYWH